MKEYAEVTRQIKTSAAIMEAFEKSFLWIIEDSGTTPTLENRELAFELFYAAYDACMDASATLNRCRAGIEIADLYVNASESDKKVVEYILNKYRG